MKIYNTEKTYEIENPDLTIGYLTLDHIQIGMTAERTAIAETGHYLYCEPNQEGVKSVIGYVIDTPGLSSKPSEPVYKDIYVYIPYTDANIDALRNRRELECFSVVNRGQLWYNTLSDQQKIELANWYQIWLNVTTVKSIPQKPIWLK